MANRIPVQDMITHLNKHLEMRMFLVGMNITAADVVVHLRIAQHFRDLKDTEKKDVPHAFRWVDHIQHLPGMIELVQNLGLFVSFPSEKEEQLSKAQLKKLAKEQYKKDQKAGGGKKEEVKANPKQEAEVKQNANQNNQTKKEEQKTQGGDAKPKK